jgi:hypothetical protein
VAGDLGYWSLVISGSNLVWGVVFGKTLYIMGSSSLCYRVVPKKFPNCPFGTGLEVSWHHPESCDIVNFNIMVDSVWVMNECNALFSTGREQKIWNGSCKPCPKGVIGGVIFLDHPVEHP